jgi:hypothetical protein
MVSERSATRRRRFCSSFLRNLCSKKLFMQIVPYMPIHPAQLHTTPVAVTIEDHHDDTASPVLCPETESNNDDHLFKRPLPPVTYTVEEPCDTSVKRTSPMKRFVDETITTGIQGLLFRSYSQSLRSNSNLSVVELKNDTNDYSFYHSKDDYFVVEPTTPR